MSYTAFISQETYGSDSAIKTVNSTRRDFDLQGEEYNPYIGSVPFSNTKPLINIGVSLASFNQYPGVNIKKVLGTICTGKFMFMIAFFAFSVLGVVNAVPTASEYMDSTPHFSNIRLEFGIANTYESNKVVDLLFDTGPVIDIVNGTDTRFYFTDDFDVVRKRLSFGDGEVELVFFYDSKSQPMAMRSVAVNDKQLNSSYIGDNSAYPAYNIKVTSADLSNTVVPVLSLEQNYPNPFNPSTTIRYSIEEPGSVSLEIYNVKGQLVKTLYQGDAEIGSHTVIWNGLDNSGNACSSGVYFYRLRTPKTNMVRKMLMLK